MEAMKEIKAAKHREIKDPRFLLAYMAPDLERVLPWNRKTIRDMIDHDLFPKGWQKSPGAYEIWPRRVVEAYLELIGADAMATLPRIAENIRNLQRAA